MTGDSRPLTALEPLVGEWLMRARFRDLPPVDEPARVTFEWLPGARFLVQRSSIPVPEAPDVIAIIGRDPEDADRYLQHYFDSRGVARLYRMTFEDRVWRLWRDTADFSPLDFRQRFTGTLSEDGRTIHAAWEICRDGTTWEPDFELTFQRA